MPPHEHTGRGGSGRGGRGGRGGGSGRGGSGRGGSGRGGAGRGGPSRGGRGRGGGRSPSGEGRSQTGGAPRSFGRGGGSRPVRSDAKSQGARRQGPTPVKKGAGKPMGDKFKRDRQAGGAAARFQKSGAAGATEMGSRAPKLPISHRTKSIDIHQASKVSEDLRSDIALFKSRNASRDTFGPQLNEFFALIPPPFIWQHLPQDVSSYRSYLSKFVRGAKNEIDGFDAWYEWAEYEQNKANGNSGAAAGASAAKKKQAGQPDTDKGEEPNEEAEKVEASTGRKGSTRQVLSKTLEERAHMRALLQMCLRHNHQRRKEGQHAFINHLNAKLTEDEVDCRSLERLRGTAHHSVSYALSRLLLGMATDDLAMLVLHCHMLFLVLQQTPITAAVILALIDEEFALETRMRAVRQRVESHQRGRDQGAAEDPAGDDAVDPDDINDPTKGERNQRLTAAVFALGALVEAAAHAMTPKDATQASTFLTFCYVEQKATRVASANLLFQLLHRQPTVLDNEEAVQWLTFAFFFYPKLEYFRPESVQMLLRLMDAPESCQARKALPPTVRQYCTLDPLEPSILEQIANALFRREQVTLIHPMVHPVWDDLFQLVTSRVASGESMKEHVSTLVHTAIAPYRRGNTDVPRRTLFQTLVTRLGQLAVQSEDAEQRAEMLHLASKTVGYGRTTHLKPTPVAELRQMPVEALNAKVQDLLRQYRLTRDSDPAATTNRTWVLRELRNCLTIPVRDGVSCPYVDDACRFLLEFGLFPPGASRDENSKNRCVYLFADTFSFTFSGSLTRPKSTLSGLEVMRATLKAEGRDKLRYDTARKNKSFLKARNRIVEALDDVAHRSVLFYENRDMEVLLTLLFLILSVDDAQNPDSVMLAKTVVPDLVQFYRTGTLETLDMFFDVLMALIMRTSAPLQVMPMMTCVRRIAVGYVLRFAKFVRSKATLDILLAPLREAYQTDSREQARQLKAKKAAAAAESEAADGEGSDSDSDADLDAAAAQDDDGENSSVGTASENDSDAEEGEEGDDAASEGATDADTATEASDDDKDESDSTDDDTDDSDSAAAGADSDDEEDDFMNADEPPTQQYIEALKGMVGDVDLGHTYPTDASNKEKSDIVRAIQLAARVGCAMRSPLVVSVYQVLLAVARENVKTSDDVVFDSIVAAIDMLLTSKNRFFGHFVSAIELFQLLADIQSYCRKMDRALVSKDSITVRAAANARRRMSKVKMMALRIFHFVAMLAYKNHAGDDVRITLSEYYKSIFCDRGWRMERVLPTIKKDLFYYRQGFAWVLLSACFEKFEEVQALDTPQRVRVFSACCTMVESMLSRLSGLPTELKEGCAAAIRGFLQSVSVRSVYDMKHTVVYNYLHTIKMVVQYNSRVQLDTEWVAKDVVGVAVDEDAIQLSGASIKVLAKIEQLLELTPRARETKAAVPVKVLYQQFEKTGAKEKGTYFRRAKRVRAKVVKALLAHRNDDPTDEERSKKRHRREELKIEDRIQRQVLRESRTKVLTKEERDEKRKNIMMAKQDRIAKNKDRKRHLHELRQKSFERWRQEKLEAAAAAGLVD